MQLIFIYFCENVLLWIIHTQKHPGILCKHRVPASETRAGITELWNSVFQFQAAESSVDLEVPGVLPCQDTCQQGGTFPCAWLISANCCLIWERQIHASRLQNTRVEKKQLRRNKLFWKKQRTQDIQDFRYSPLPYLLRWQLWKMILINWKNLCWMLNINLWNQKAGSLLCEILGFILLKINMFYIDQGKKNYPSINGTLKECF